MTKLKWVVDPAPTGKYRSFECRGWPHAEIPDGDWVVKFRCADEYRPAKVRSGDHAEIKIDVSDRRKTQRPGAVAFEWKTLKQRASALAEAKEIAQKFFDANPAFFGLEVKS